MLDVESRDASGGGALPAGGAYQSGRGDSELLAEVKQRARLQITDLPKFAVVGGRDFGDTARLYSVLDRALKKWGMFWVISGGAGGADYRAVCWAENRKLPYCVFPANWTAYGRAAGPIRNGQIVQFADRVIAFWDGQSRGTQSTIELARTVGKPVHVMRY